MNASTPIDIVLGITSIETSTSLSGGNLGNSLGKKSGHPFNIRIFVIPSPHLLDLLYRLNKPRTYFLIIFKQS